MASCNAIIAALLVAILVAAPCVGQALAHAGLDLGGIGPALVQAATCTHDSRPKQIHLALGQDATQLVVVWSTLSPASATLVEYRENAGASEPVVLSVGSSYFHPSGGRHGRGQTIHTAMLDVEPGSSYLYRVGDGACWSVWFNMKAPHLAYTTDRPLNLLVIGDFGYERSLCLPSLIAESRTTEYAAVLHTGDHAYDLSTRKGSVGDKYLQKVMPLAATVPFMVSPGNHEQSSNFSEYKARFRMPRAFFPPGIGERESEIASDNLFYSFDIGPAHILIYNTEVFFWPEHFGATSMQLQHKWMEADLAAASAPAARAQRPWIIVVGHRPMYCISSPHGMKGRECSAENEASRTGTPSCSDQVQIAGDCPEDKTGADYRADLGTYPVEQLLYKYGVDLAFYGHQHDYERYYPVFDHAAQSPANSAHISFSAYRDPGATVHITTGAAGNREMHHPRHAADPPGGECLQKQPWCAFESGFAPGKKASSDFSYTRLKIFNDTHLYLEQYSVIFERVVDGVWVIQTAHGPFGAPRSAPGVIQPAATP